jgi:hypothetical protein
MIFCEEGTLQSSSLFSFLQPPVISYLLGSNNILSTLLSNNLCSSLMMKSQVSLPYKTAGKIIVLNKISREHDSTTLIAEIF